MFLNLPGIVFQPISADVTRQTIKEHFLLRYGIKLLAHTGLTCSDAISPDDFDGVEVILEQL